MITLFLAGCSVDYKVDIESDTSWSGAFDNRSVDGKGNETVDVGDTPPVCAVVQKDTKEGFLTAKMVCHYRGPQKIFKEKATKDRATTTAAYGVVSVCASD